MGAQHFGDRPDDVLTIAAAPDEGTIPELLDESGEGAGRPVEKLGSSGEVNRVTADDQRLKDLELSAVEPVQGPLNAGARAGAGGQRGQVARSGSGQVGSPADQYS